VIVGHKRLLVFLLLSHCLIVSVLLLVRLLASVLLSVCLLVAVLLSHCLIVSVLCVCFFSRIKTSRHRFKDNKDINIEQKPEVEKKLGDNVIVGHKL
jgi:uncharacterized protein YneF (UPF0154 family)